MSKKNKKFDISKDVIEMKETFKETVDEMDNIEFLLMLSILEKFFSDVDDMSDNFLEDEEWEEFYDDDDYDDEELPF